MSLYLVELLVRLGVAVIADGTIKPRWAGSDQAKVCKRVQARWWRGRRVRGLTYGSGKLTAAKYYCLREIVTGSNWQAQQYVRAPSLAVVKRLLA